MIYYVVKCLAYDCINDKFDRNGIHIPRDCCCFNKPINIWTESNDLLNEPNFIQLKALYQDFCMKVDGNAKKCHFLTSTNMNVVIIIQSLRRRNKNSLYLENHAVNISNPSLYF